MKEKRSAEGIAAASCENADSMRELSLISRALEKCRIPMRIDVGSVGGFLREELASLGIGGEVDIGIPEIEPRTVYRLTDRFSRSFTIFSHGGEEGRRVAVIGPYLSFELTEKHGFSIGERLRLSPSDTRELSKYLQTLATVKEGSPINAMLSALFESTWGSAGYTVVTLNEGEVVNEPTPQAIASGSDNILKMRSMERRYEFENVLMDAVTRGSTDTEDLLRYSITPETLEQRVLDPLRNAKNYCIIMNTLLRKAAERGGVHPLYLDEMSSANARRIEALSSHQRTPELMSEMLRGYCRLVKRHAYKDYSPVVRRAVIMIDADLSADLSAGAIAEVLDVSLGYLSSAFKRDVGRTLSEYVRERRMEYAEQLLRGTDLQVQSVAQSVGMVDLNYFTRLFKSHTGMTPTEFRRKKQ
jgi:AraC-like DNA-binding protein